MMTKESADTQRNSLARKAASGAIGGLLSSAMMILLEVIFRKTLVRWEDPLPDSGLGFQAVFRPDGPVKRAALKFLQNDRSEIPGFPTAVVLHGIFGVTAARRMQLQLAEDRRFSSPGLLSSELDCGFWRPRLGYPCFR